MKTDEEEFIVSNGIKYRKNEAEKIMNSENLLAKIQEIDAKITHFHGNWEFRTLQQKLDWFTENVPFAIMINWFN